MTRFCIALTLAAVVGACENVQDPELKTLGATIPMCLVWCTLDFTLVDTREGTQSPSVSIHSNKTQGMN